MNQVSGQLRRSTRGYHHWCDACQEMHILPDKGWTFNGKIDKPTFTPSFLHQGVLTEKINGKWTGNWVRDKSGNTIPFICHYILTDGILNYYTDCTHNLVGKSVSLPDLPNWLTDEGENNE